MRETAEISQFWMTSVMKNGQKSLKLKLIDSWLPTKEFKSCETFQMCGYLTCCFKLYSSGAKLILSHRQKIYNYCRSQAENN